jgi:undecaprenyl diphosphate synthase
LPGRSRVHELSPDEQAIYRRLNPGRLPQHIAMIMDGNGRWAGKRSLKRFFGHQQGAESVQYVVETAARIDLPWLTLYAFSLENSLRRPKAEVNFLMRLLRSYLANNVGRMNDNNVRIQYIGRTDELPSEVRDKMQWAAEATRAQLRIAHRNCRRISRLANRGMRTEARSKLDHRRGHPPQSLHGPHARPRPGDPHFG